MGAAVAQGKHAPVAAPPQHQRNAQQHGGGQLALAQIVGAQRRIPVVVDQRRGRPLNRHARFCSGHQGHLAITIALSPTLVPIAPSASPGHNLHQSLFVRIGRDCLARPMLFAPRIVERHALRSNPAGAHLVTAGKDVQHAGHRGNTHLGIVLPALQPAAEPGRMGHHVHLDALRTHPPGDPVDGAVGITPRASYVQAANDGLALISLRARACRWEQEELFSAWRGSLRADHRSSPRPPPCPGDIRPAPGRRRSDLPAKNAWGRSS